MRVDDRDSELCPDCGVSPSRAGCGCWDDGSGASEQNTPEHGRRGVVQSLRSESITAGIVKRPAYGQIPLSLSAKSVPPGRASPLSGLAARACAVDREISS